MRPRGSRVGSNGRALLQGNHRAAQVRPWEKIQCRRFEVPAPAAANSFRNFKSKSGTRIICLLVPLLLPKFVSGGTAMDHELRKRGTSAMDADENWHFAGNVEDFEDEDVEQVKVGPLAIAVYRAKGEFY